MPATAIAGLTRARRRLGDRWGEDLRRLGLEQLELLGARWVGAQEALGLADDAGLGGDVEVDGGAVADDELG